MLKIYTIQHIPTENKGVILGRSKDPIDPVFRSFYEKKQAQGLVMIVSDLVASSGISASVYTSSIPRQKETSEVLFKNSPFPIVIDERLRQIDNGPIYTGMKSSLAKEDYLDFIDRPFPQGESFRDFANRYKEFLDEKLFQYKDHIIITIGWRLSSAILAHICRGIDLEEAITNNSKISGPFIYG